MQEILQHLPIAERVKYVAKERFAWPGGYALGVLTDDGGCLCSACVERNTELILEDLQGHCKGSGWFPAAAYVTDADDDGVDGEEPVCCDNCGRPITDSTNKER